MDLITEVRRLMEESQLICQNAARIAEESSRLRLNSQQNRVIRSLEENAPLSIYLKDFKAFE